MAKQVVGQAKFPGSWRQGDAGAPVGTSLGKFGVNLGQFVQQFNDKTREYNGTPIPVVVTVYNDRTFEFVTKSPPAANLLMQAAGIAKGAGVPNRDKVGKVTRAQIDDICEKKKDDLNARDLEHARRMIEGTARSMGIEVVD
ncbi:MAG: 50S ribosomal protein L11 [Pirellulaceae bacterium]